MKKQMLLCTALVMGAMAYVMPVIAAEGGVESLRGAKALEETSASPELKRWQPDRDPIPRDYIQQPPLIPHSTKGYVINLKFNKCLTCHSWSNYKEAEATKISQTHFRDREGNDLANVSARRYFCTQCHVPQTETPPLVENTFTPVEAVKGR